MRDLGGSAVFVLTPPGTARKHAWRLLMMHVGPQCKFERPCNCVKVAAEAAAGKEIERILGPFHSPVCDVPSGNPTLAEIHCASLWGHPNPCRFDMAVELAVSATESLTSRVPPDPNCPHCKGSGRLRPGDKLPVFVAAYLNEIASVKQIISRITCGPELPICATGVPNILTPDGRWHHGTKGIRLPDGRSLYASRALWTFEVLSLLGAHLDHAAVIFDIAYFAE